MQLSCQRRIAGNILAPSGGVGVRALWSASGLFKGAAVRRTSQALHWDKVWQ